MSCSGSRHLPWLSRAAPLPGLLAALLLAGSPALAGDLYSATVIVTGRDNLAERARGFREALPKMLTRLTVDPEVASRVAAEGLDVDTAELVTGFTYHDRKEGIQISDEQGTRERSFELTVAFDRDRIDAALSLLGAEAWTDPRPLVAVKLEIDNSVGRFMLTRQSASGYGQRLAIDDGARALALPVAIPGDAAAADAGITLSGAMRLEPAGFWDTDWHLAGAGIDERFAYDDTTFDLAIDGALVRSARILARKSNN